MSDKYEAFIDALKAAVPTHYGTDPDSVKLFTALTAGQQIATSTYVFPTKIVVAVCENFINTLATYSGDIMPGIEHDFYSSVPLMIYCPDENSPSRTLVWTSGCITYTSNDHLILLLNKDLYERFQNLSGDYAG